MSYKEGDWFVYCDICGQRIYASQSSTLPIYSGRGGLVVCKHDTDVIDYGLKPYKPKRELSVSFVRPNHTNTDDGSPTVDLETMSYQWYLAASQDGAILMSSQDDAWLIASEPV